MDTSTESPRLLTRRHLFASPLAVLLARVLGLRPSPAEGREPPAVPPGPPEETPVPVHVPQVEIDDFDLSFLPPADLAFALVADTHAVARPPAPLAECFGEELLGVQRRNELNNPRTAKVYAQLNAVRPAFVIHLGDLVHGHPRDRRWPNLVKKANGLLRRLEVAAYLVAGNHDVGNKLSVPFRARSQAGSDHDPRDSYYVSAENVEAYERAFGPSYYHFERSGNLFVVINASVLSSGLEEEAEQWRWLEQTLAESRAATNVFLAMHSLPYWSRVDEPGEGNYEVVDEPARSRLLALCAEHRVRAIFAGHIHHDHLRYHGSTLIAASPSASFSRDHWGLYYPLPPPTWDPARAGYCYVRVRGREVVRQVVRTVDLLPAAAPCQHDNPFPPRRLMARQSADGVAAPIAVTVPVMRWHPGLSAPGNAISSRRSGVGREDEQRIAWISGGSAEEWLEIRFARPRKISRVVVHPGIRGPFGYRIQLRKGSGPWASVARGATEPPRGDRPPPPLEHRVGGARAAAVRLLVSEATGRVSVRALEIFDSGGADVAALPSFARAVASGSERNVKVVSTAAFSQGFDLNPSYLRLDPRATAFEAVSPVPGLFNLGPRVVESAAYASRQGTRLWVVLSAPAAGAGGRRPADRGEFSSYCRHLAQALPEVGVWEIDGELKQARAAISAVRRVSAGADFAVREGLDLPARFAVTAAGGAPAEIRRPTLLLHPPFPSRRQAEPAAGLAGWLAACLGSEHAVPCVSLLAGEGLLDGWDDPMPAFYVVRTFNTVLAGARPSARHCRDDPAFRTVHLASAAGRFVVVSRAPAASREPAAIQLLDDVAEAWWIDPLTSTSRRLVLQGRRLEGLLLPDHPVILRLV